MNWICKYCNNSFLNLSSSDKANHSRWCDLNPKKKEYIKILTKSRDSITLESIKKRNSKIKSAWSDGKYEGANFGKSFKGKTHSDNTKKILSEKRILWLNNNKDKHPWKNKDKFLSKPCEHLKTILIDNGFNFIQEFQPLDNRFFSIDIAFIDKKIALEINGNQHYTKNGKLKKYYLNRHKLIEKNGWKIIEIHYSKVYKHEYIKGLITWLRSSAG